MPNKSVILSGSGIAFMAEETAEGIWTVSLPPTSSLRLLFHRSVWESGSLRGRPKALGFAEIAGTSVREGLAERIASCDGVLLSIAEIGAAVRMAPDDGVRACLVSPFDPTVGERASKTRCLDVLDELRSAAEVETELLRSLSNSAAELRLSDPECTASFRTDAGLLVCGRSAPDDLAETLLGMILLSVDEPMGEDEIRSRLSSSGVDGDRMSAWLAEELEVQELRSPSP